MSNKLVRASLFLAGTICCVAAALPYTLAQDKRLPVTPSRILTAQEIANHAERARWTYTIELIDAESKRVLAEHDGSTPFDAPLTLAPPISTESLLYHLTVQQYRLEGDDVHLLIDIAHRVAPAAKSATRTEWKSENTRFEAVAKLGEKTDITIDDWLRDGDNRKLQLSILVGKVSPK